jgi:hypothetical protein
VRGQVKLYFPEFDFAAEDYSDVALMTELRSVGTNVRDYLCYVLLDFAAVDPDLESEPLREAFKLTSELGWDSRLESLIVKELKMKKREAQRIRAEAREKVEQAVDGEKAIGAEGEESDE